MYSVTTAGSIVGMAQEEVSNLIFSGLIIPEGYDLSNGKQRAVLSERNVRELKVIKRLRAAGIKRNYIKSIIELLDESKQSWWADDKCFIVIGDGEQWYITTNAFQAKNIEGMKDNDSTVIIKL